jgi:hypothetical protein
MRLRATVLAGALCAALLSLSSAGLASGEAAEGHANTWLGLPMPFWQGLNLVLFLGVLVYFLRKPLSNWLAERRDGVLIAQKKAADDRVKAEQLTRRFRHASRRSRTRSPTSATPPRRTPFARKPTS